MLNETVLRTATQVAVFVTDSNFCFINCDRNFYEVDVFLTEGFSREFIVAFHLVFGLPWLIDSSFLFHMAAQAGTEPFDRILHGIIAFDLHTKVNQSMEEGRS